MKIKERIIIVGAGEAGEIILSEYSRLYLSDQVIGFVDDDPRKIGCKVGNKDVFCRLDGINDLIKKYNVNKVIVAIPSAEKNLIEKTVLEIINNFPEVSIQILPEITKYFSRNLINDLADPLYSELLDRDEFELDLDKIQDYLKERVILITGAGGSIGSEICNQLQKFKIKKIICLGRGENSIYELAKKLNRSSYTTEQLDFKICDIKDYNLLKKIFEETRPDIVFHAAAHKHVPLMEFNACEALQNNIGGTNNVLQISAEFDIEKFVLISTDKAVNPTNIMGATKRVAELLCSYYHKRYCLDTAIVRFGNVLGSRGSVLPLFKEQIEHGGPVTITDPEIKRFFMSIPEASLLVINAAAYANGGETFVLNMGKQYKIVDIACKLMQLYGLVPGKDIEIVYTGLRPGEKLYEELYYSDQDLLKTKNKMIFRIKDHAAECDSKKIERLLENVIPEVTNYSLEELKDILHDLVNEYSFIKTDQLEISSSRIIS